MVNWLDAEYLLPGCEARIDAIDAALTPQQPPPAPSPVEVSPPARRRQRPSNRWPGAIRIRP
jgi:hypothetical protein